MENQLLEIILHRQIRLLKSNFLSYEHLLSASRLVNTIVFKPIMAVPSVLILSSQSRKMIVVREVSRQFKRSME
jgi:hypothetical protein